MSLFRLSFSVFWLWAAHPAVAADCGLKIASPTVREAVAAYLRLAEFGLKNQAVTPEELEAAARSQRAVSPMSPTPQSWISLARGFQQTSTDIPEEIWRQLTPELKRLAAEGREQDQKTRTARQETAPLWEVVSQRVLRDADNRAKVVNTKTGFAAIDANEKRIRVTYEDGTFREVDLRPNLRGLIDIDAVVDDSNQIWAVYLKDEEGELINLSNGDKYPLPFKRIRGIQAGIKESLSSMMTYLLPQKTGLPRVLIRNSTREGAIGCIVDVKAKRGLPLALTNGSLELARLKNGRNIYFGNMDYDRGIIAYDFTQKQKTILDVSIPNQPANLGIDTNIFLDPLGNAFLAASGHKDVSVYPLATPEQPWHIAKVPALNFKFFFVGDRAQLVYTQARKSGPDKLVFRDVQSGKETSLPLDSVNTTLQVFESAAAGPVVLIGDPGLLSDSHSLLIYDWKTGVLHTIALPEEFRKLLSIRDGADGRIWMIFQSDTGVVSAQIYGPMV